MHSSYWHWPLGGCCLEREEPPNVVYLSDAAAENLSRACRISNSESLRAALYNALFNYVFDQHKLRKKPGEIWPCRILRGTVCELEVPCGKPYPDMGDWRKNCPPRDMAVQEPPASPPLGEHYMPCLPGCGGAARIPDKNIALLNPDELKTIEEAMQLSGAGSRQQALEIAILHYEQIWLDNRKKPDFYQHSYNLPHLRKPDSPCPWVARYPSLVEDGGPGRPSF